MFSKDYKKPDSENTNNADADGDVKARPDDNATGEAGSQGFRDRMAARGAGRQQSAMAMLAGLDKDDTSIPSDTPTRSLYNREEDVAPVKSDAALPADEAVTQTADPIAEAQDRLADSGRDAPAMSITATAMGADGRMKSGGGGGDDERGGGNRLGDISQFAFAGLAVLGLAGLSVLAAESALKGQPDDGDAASGDLDFADGGAGGIVAPKGDASAVALADAATPAEVKPWFDYRGTADRLAARKAELDLAEKQEAALAASQIDAKAASVIAESEATRLAEEARLAANNASAADKASLEEKARIAEDEARRLAQAAAAKTAAESADRIAREEAEATRLAALDAQKKLEADQEASRLAQIKAAEVADANAKAEAEAEVKRLAEAEAKAKADAEAARIAEADAKATAEAEAKRLADVQAKEAEAARIAALKAKQDAEAEAKRLADLEAEKAAKAEAQRLADLKVKEAAEAEALRVANAAAARKAEAEAKRVAAAEAEKRQAARLAAAQAKRTAAQTAVATAPKPAPRPPIVFAAYNGSIPAPASTKPMKPVTQYASQTSTTRVERTYANTGVRSVGSSQNAAIVRTYPVSRSAPVQLTTTSTSVRPFQRVGAAFQPSPRRAEDFMGERVRRTQLTEYPNANMAQFEAEFLSLIAAQPDGTTGNLTTPDGRALSLTLERSINQQVAKSGTRPLAYTGSGTSTVMSVTNPSSGLQVSVLCRDIAYAFAGQERGRFAACQSPDDPSVWNMARASEQSGSSIPSTQIASRTMQTATPVRRTVQSAAPQTQAPTDLSLKASYTKPETIQQVTDAYRASPRVKPINFSLAVSDAATKKSHRYATGPHKLQF